MSSGNKVYKYRCNICQRTVEQVSDNRRPDPLRCVITDQCRGLLEPQSSRKGDRAKLTTPVADLADRVPRGTTYAVTEAPADPVTVILSSFVSSNGLAVACPRRVINGGVANYSVKTDSSTTVILESRLSTTLYSAASYVDMLVYELTNAVLTAQKYVFIYVGIAQQVEGVDDSREQRLLRFGSTDTLTVLANGVELDPSAYDRTANDTIRLTPSIVASEVTIEVYVSKDRSLLIDETKLTRLSCKSLSETDAVESALRSGCAWGDIARLVTPDGVDRSLLFCNDLSALEEGKTYSVARFEGIKPDGTAVRFMPEEFWLLLSDEPHSFVDKRLDELVNGASLVAAKFSFTYDLSEATGRLVPVAAESVLTVPDSRLAPYPEVRITPVSTSGAERAYVKRPEAHIIGPA